MSKHSLTPLPEIKVQPLLYTPLPLPTESLKGFLLRTCEENGYERLNVMTSIAGLTDRQTSIPAPDVGRLAALLSFNPNVLLKMGYWHEGLTQEKSSLMILGHELPQLYSSPHVGICPECISEKGFIEAFWDLKISIACPEHQRKTIDECEVCKQTPGNRSLLNWNRGKMLSCRKGHDLGHSLGEVVEDKLALDLLKVIKAKLELQPFDSLVGIGHHKFPLQNMESMSLRSLLGLVTRLSKPTMPILEGNEGKDLSIFVNDLEALGRAAKVLADWPLGFYEYLSEWRGLANKSDWDSISFSRQFINLHSSLFKSIKSKWELDWARKEFDNFGRDMWKYGKYSSKVGSKAHNGSMVGIYKLSQHLGVHVNTIQSMVKNGTLKPTVINVKGSEMWLFDLKGDLPIYNSGESLNLREAAAYIGIPVSVLRGCAQTGVMEINSLAKPGRTFNVDDLDTLKARLMQLAPNNYVDIDNNSLISLGSMMLMSTGADTVKLDMLKAYLHGGLNSIGRIADTPKGIVFNKSDVLALASELKQKYYKGMSVAEAGKRLVCSPSIVLTLVEKGYLEITQSPVGRKIMTDSIVLFEEQYISPSRFSTDSGYEKRIVLNRAKSYGIELLTIETTGFKSNTSGYFIAKSNVPILLDILKVDGTSRKRKPSQHMPNN